MSMRSRRAGSDESGCMCVLFLVGVLMFGISIGIDTTGKESYKEGYAAAKTDMEREAFARGYMTRKISSHTHVIYEWKDPPKIRAEEEKLSVK